MRLIGRASKHIVPLVKYLKSAWGVNFKNGAWAFLR